MLGEMEMSLKLEQFHAREKMNTNKLVLIRVQRRGRGA